MINTKLSKKSIIVIFIMWITTPFASSQQLLIDKITEQLNQLSIPEKIVALEYAKYEINNETYRLFFFNFGDSKNLIWSAKVISKALAFLTITAERSSKAFSIQLRNLTEAYSDFVQGKLEIEQLRRIQRQDELGTEEILRLEYKNWNYHIDQINEDRKFYLIKIGKQIGIELTTHAKIQTE